MPDVTHESVTANVQRLADTWAPQRADRQRRRNLDPADFAALRDTGFLLAAVPTDLDGLYRSVPESTRWIADMLRMLARVDSSMALVSAMHPAVLQPYAEVPGDDAKDWAEQRRWLYQTAKDGGQW